MDLLETELPADAHVHTEWSWDASRVGEMDASCARATTLGLPAVAFTEHVDFTPFRAGFLAENYHELVIGGTLTAPQLDVEGYLECVQRCRAKYRELTILTGVEVGQPHLHQRELVDLIAHDAFDRVLGSLHCLSDGEEFAEPWELFPRYPAADVFRTYLLEIPRMVDGSQAFSTFAHIDYPVRSWPQDAKPFNPSDFQEELRHALKSLAEGERALEINTRLPLAPVIVRWWREAGGRRVTFGSDAHVARVVGDGLTAAGQVARAEGFLPDRKPGAPWIVTTQVPRDLASNGGGLNRSSPVVRPVATAGSEGCSGAREGRAGAAMLVGWARTGGLGVCGCCRRCPPRVG